MATNLHGQVPQILLIAQITLSPPAFYVYRLLGAAVLQLNFPLEAFFIAWCSPVVVSSPASYVYRTPSAVWGAAVFQVQCFSLSHSFLHLFRFAGMPLPPLIVCIRLVICKGVVFFLCRIPYTVPCCFDLLYALRYKRYANVTHYLGLGLRVFCPVLRVSLPFSRGSVATLFDSTIYFHFNIFKSPTKLQSSRFQRPPFSFGTGIQIHCMYFV